MVVSLPEHAPRVSGKRQPIGNSTGGRSASLNYVSGKMRWRSADVLGDGKTITSHSTPGPLCCHSGPSGGVGHPGFCQGLELLASFSGVPKILRAQGTRIISPPLARTRSRPGNSDAMEASSSGIVQLANRIVLIFPLSPPLSEDIRSAVSPLACFPPLWKPCVFLPACASLLRTRQC